MEVLLKPLDVVVSVKAAVLAVEPGWTVAQMARELGMDLAQVFRAMKQAATARLLVVDNSGANPTYLPQRAAILELLQHGVKYMMVPARGRLTRGMPTAHAAPVLAKDIVSTSDSPPVWPDPEGSARGESFEPLHRCVPGAARRDPRFYDAMALVDAIRDGRARERNLAASILERIIGGRGH